MFLSVSYLSGLFLQPNINRQAKYTYKKTHMQDTVVLCDASSESLL